MVPNIADVDYDIFERTAPGLKSFGSSASKRRFRRRRRVQRRRVRRRWALRVRSCRFSRAYTVAVLTQTAARCVVTTRFSGQRPSARGYFQLAIDQTGGDGRRSGVGRADSTTRRDGALLDGANRVDATAEHLRGGAALGPNAVASTSGGSIRPDPQRALLVRLPARHTDHAAFGKTSHFGFAYEITFDYVGIFRNSRPSSRIPCDGNGRGSGVVNVSTVVEGLHARQDRGVALGGKVVRPSRRRHTFSLGPRAADGRSSVRRLCGPWKRPSRRSCRSGP